jgi:hypothetical protein
MDEVNEPLDTILTLPAGWTAADIACACRETGLEFINHSREWGKPELSLWLTSSYARLTAHTKPREDASGSSVWPVPLLRQIDPRLIGRIMSSARAEILETLNTIANDGSASFVLRALISGSVVRCEDAHHEPSWAPTAEVSRLADRVLSLFAVDYLARGADYETQLFICRQCENVCFDELARTTGLCHEHGAGVSLTAPRGRHTLPYPPLGA